MSMKSNSPKKLGLPIFLGSVALIGVVVSAALMQNPGRLLNANGVYGDTSDYTVVLDSSNKYTSGTTKEVTTSSGQWSISFEYTNASALSNGHVTLANGGKLVNTREFISLDYLKIHCDGAGTLRFRTSYDGATWGGYATVSDNEIYNLASNPYYIELTATGGSVNIYQATYQYTCVPNEAAQGTEVPGEETWDLLQDASELKAGDQIIIAGYNSSKYYALRNALVGSFNYYQAANEISVTNNKATVTADHDIWTLGGSSGAWTIKNGSNYLNGVISGGHYNTLLQDSADGTWNISVSSNKSYFASTNGVYLSFSVYKGTPEFAGSDSSSKYAFIFKKNVSSSHTEYDTPVDEVGFTVSDSNATGVYNTNSIYASDNGLVVKAKWSDGTQTTVATTDYTYAVSATQGGSPINVNQAFGTAGTYYVSVSYKDYLPQIIQIHVSEPAAVLQNIVVHSSTVTFTTAQKLSDFTSGITVDLSYDKSSANVNGVAYSAFSSYGVALTLIDPNGVAHSITSTFDVAGTWTIKVASTSDASVFGIISITVSAIPVEEISFDNDSVTIYEGKTVQLTVTVSPSTATNKEVTWSVTNADPAGCVTVSETGLVSGVAAGSANVIATAKDGSTVFGTCSVTVLANTDPDKWELVTNASTLAAGDKLVFASYGNGKTAGNITSGYMSALSSTFNNDNTEITSLADDSTVLTLGGTFGAWTFENADGQLLGASSKSLTWDSGTTTWSISIASDDATITNGDETNNGKILYNVSSPRFKTYTSSVNNSMQLPQIYRGSTTTPIYPTALSLDGDAQIGASESTQLVPTYTPATTNQKSLTWSSSNTDVATVDSTGLVTAKSTATIGQYTDITARAKANASDTTGNIVATFRVTIKAIAVTSVTLNKSILSLAVDGISTLVATVNPNNAANKAVTWSVVGANPSGCVTVDQTGLVTGVAAGTATVKVVSNADSTKYAECAVTVSASGSTDYIDATMTVGNNASAATVSGDDAIKLGSGSSGGTMTISIPAGAVSVKFYAAAWNGTSGTTASLSLGTGTISQSSIDLVANSGIKQNSPFTLNGDPSDYLFTFNLSGVSSATTLTITSSNRAVVWGAQVCLQATDPTGVSIGNIELAPGGSKTLVPTYTPSNANKNLGITWSKTSGSSTISVDTEGKVTVASNATVGQSAVIRATLSEVSGNKYGECTVSVVESAKDSWTLLFYVCGADLESEGGSATSDLNEILQVRSEQPDDVNIVVETGGSKSWTMSGVSATKLQRWEINSSSSSMIKKQELSNANMGDGSTFQNFLEWGISNYPAERYGVFMWNHGGAMDGCCFDENYEKASNGNGLLPWELHEAVSGARSNCGISEKLEFIAYDACLMAVQDIAEWNSYDFNYQISSQETEWDGGYDYDKWLPTLYNDGDAYNADTVTVLTKIGTTFMEYYASYNDQTQSVYDLSKMAAYKNAWEDMVTTLKNTVNSSSAWSTFTGYVNQALKYGYSESASDYNNGYPSDVFDVNSAMTKLKNGYSGNSTLVSHFNNIISKLNDVIVYNECGTKTGIKGSCGMNLFCPISGYNQLTDQTWSQVYYPANYSAQCTNFTKWQALCAQYGNWA